MRRITPLLTLALLLSAALSASAALLTGSGLGSHDPSRIVECNGRFYVYSTGGGMKYSDDRINWTTGTSPFPNGVPASAKAVISDNQGIWAPDVIFLNNKYYLYYAVAASDDTETLTALLTSPTLDPGASNYKWTDVGVVLTQHDKQDKISGIDPCPIIDPSGNLWVTYGSGYGTGAGYTDPSIFLVRLNNTTGLLLNSTKYGIGLGHCEGSFLYYHAGNYFLFYNTGSCCSGSSSTYTIHVCESSTITGPYHNKAGTNGADEIFYASTDGRHGPGHMGILDLQGSQVMSFHYYPDSGGSLLGMQSLIWGADGWPVAGANFPDGTYKIGSAYNTSLFLGIKSSDNSNGAPIDEETYSSYSSQQWKAAINSDGYYSITSVFNGKAVDLYQSSATDGTLIDAWTSGGSDNQRWFIEETSDGNYRMFSKSTIKVIDAPYGQHSAGTNAEEWDLNGGINQKWSFGTP